MNFVSGFPNGTFKPDDSLTRAQYAALLAKAFELLPRREAADFWAPGSPGLIELGFWLDIQTAGFARSRI
jgi:hypothetical protein